MAAVGEQTRGPLIARTRRGLILEFVALFIAAPVAIAVFVNPQYMFAVLSGFCLLAVVLIRLTGDYHWKSLVSGWGEVRWGRTAVFCVFVAVAAFLVMAATKPGFPAAWLIHGLAGNILFTMGMGEFFWSGNVVRPF